MAGGRSGTRIDRLAVALAAAVWLGAATAWVAIPIPLIGLLVIVGVRFRQPVVLISAGLLLGATLGIRAHDGLVVDLLPRVDQQVVEVVSDPQPTLDGVRLEARWESKRYTVYAYRTMAGVLSDVSVGDRVEVSGSVRPIDHTNWATVRHLVGQIAVEDVGTVVRATGPYGWANSIRSVIASGSLALPEHLRPLYLGLLLGDDRGQPVETQDAFRAAGISHLLAVSGQNVALVLALLAPLISRLPTKGQGVAVLVALVFFALVTRFEPSVLRAVVMAGLAVVSAASGRPGSGVRHLAVAVMLLVLIDPFLVRSLGFQLSVAATFGILMMSRPFAARLPFPTIVGEPLALTLSAQLGVAPLLILSLDGVPLLGIPANLLVGWSAGLVVALGLPAGMVVGLVPGHLDFALFPIGLLIAWISLVADVCVRLPALMITTGHLAILVPVVTAACLYQLCGRPLSRVAIAVSASAGMLFVVLLWMKSPVPEGSIADYAWFQNDSAGSAIVVVTDDGPASVVLRTLHHSGVREVRLVISAAASPARCAVVEAVRDRYSNTAVWGPCGGHVPPPSTSWRLGGHEVAVGPDGLEDIDVRVAGSSGVPSGRAPPTRS